MALVTAEAAEAVAPTLALVAVSTEAVDPLAATTAAVVAITEVLPGSAVGDRPRGLAVVPVAPAVQVPVLGLGKVTAAATHLRDGISSHPVISGLEVTTEWALLRPGPALPPWQQGLSACRITLL
jgi:hypothetical protein